MAGNFFASVVKGRLRSSLLNVVQKRYMNLQEYQSKQIMADNGLHVQRFRVVSSTEEAKNAILGRDSPLTCQEYVIKAQVLAGGRGKGHFRNSKMQGGVKLTKDKEEACELAGKMLNDHLITNQTTKDGVLVSKVMIAEALDIEKEFYVAILLDRAAGGPIVVASPCGGMNIEEVAHNSPNEIHKFPVPVEGDTMSDELAIRIAKEGLSIKDDAVATKAAKEIAALYKLFMKTDATQIEINPLGVTPTNDVVCFDAKLEFDENARFRQPWLDGFPVEDDTDPRVNQAKESNLNFVPMDGNIGCLVNGAGLAMATMDIIHHYGGAPANFLDVGGGVNQTGVENAFKLITQDKSVKAILVNIFGGIVNCETVAKGLIAAKHLVNVPLVVRLEGTNQEAARKLLSNYSDIISAGDLGDAAQKVVAAAHKS
ncbi:Succinate--CoA ligase [GDP-forming] subunit beta, mitochondrial [Halotydeus destructor]|nr:Succinate--CoA ligase [GDP-forming] subunit beta, mitochondrial [Halotydeus destructor]